MALLQHSGIPGLLLLVPVGLVLLVRNSIRRRNAATNDTGQQEDG